MFSYRLNGILRGKVATKLVLEAKYPLQKPLKCNSKNLKLVVINCLTFAPKLIYKIFVVCGIMRNTEDEFICIYLSSLKHKNEQLLIYFSDLELYPEHVNMSKVFRESQFRFQGG